MNSLSKSRFNRKQIVITLIVIVLLAGGVVGWYFISRQNTNQHNTTTDRPVNSVDYSGPTEEEVQAGNKQKEANKEREKLDQQPAATVASVIVTDASQYGDTIEVRAYIPNIYTSAGKCIVTFSQVGQKDVVTEGSPFTDAKTTQCGAMNIARSAFSSAGTWKVTVSYASTTAEGKSASQDIIIK